MTAAVVLALLLQPAAVEPPAFTFRLKAPVRWLTRDWVVVSWELENTSRGPRQASHRPGVAAVATCTTARGTVGGAPGGAWSKDGPAPRRWFVTLAPGEMLTGEKALAVPKACVSGIEVHAVYESESGDEHGLSVPAPRLWAEPLAIARPAADRER